MPSALPPLPSFILLPLSCYRVLHAPVFWCSVFSQMGQQKYSLYKLLTLGIHIHLLTISHCILFCLTALHFMLGQKSSLSLFLKIGGEQLTWENRSEDETGWRLGPGAFWIEPKLWACVLRKRQGQVFTFHEDFPFDYFKLRNFYEAT